MCGVGFWERACVVWKPERGCLGCGSLGASILERVVREGLTEKLTCDLTAVWGSRPGEEGCQGEKQPELACLGSGRGQEVGSSRPWETRKSRECSGHMWTLCL